MHWNSLPPSTRIAASAFAIHSILLLVDLFAFDAAYALNRPAGWFMPLVRIAAFSLFALSLLRPEPRPWIIGFFILAAFLVRDIAKLAGMLSDPSASTAQHLLNAALFATVTIGVLALLGPALRRRLNRQAPH